MSRFYKRKDLSNQYYGYVKVIEEVYNDENYRRYWKCKCICGNYCIIRGDVLVKNKSVSCGCKTSELQSSKRSKLDGKEAAISKIYRQYKKRGNESGKGFSLTISEFESLIFANCNYCNSLPSNKCKIHLKNITTILVYNGIDRLDSSLGYHKENCVTSCITCNKAKSDMSLNKFIEWVEKVFNFSVKINL